MATAVANPASSASSPSARARQVSHQSNNEPLPTPTSNGQAHGSASSSANGAIGNHAATHSYHSTSPPIVAGADGATSISAEEFIDVLCGGCGQTINEDSADAGVIHFATQLWHIDCFRCAKCHDRVSTDRDDILLLSDGHPICGQCNYSCQICSLPILEEAIMTGDESYHASCFTCRSCHNRIEELVFAKTSQGIYCMPCHNERVARSRKHAESKRRARTKDGKEGSSSRRSRTQTNESSHSGPTGDDANAANAIPPLPSRPSDASTIAPSETTSSLADLVAEEETRLRTESSTSSLHEPLVKPSRSSSKENNLPASPARSITSTSSQKELGLQSPKLPTTPQQQSQSGFPRFPSARSPLTPSTSQSVGRLTPGQSSTPSLREIRNRAASPHRPATAEAASAESLSISKSPSPKPRTFVSPLQDGLSTNGFRHRTDSADVPRDEETSTDQDDHDLRRRTITPSDSAMITTTGAHDDGIAGLGIKQEGAGTVNGDDTPSTVRGPSVEITPATAASSQRDARLPVSPLRRAINLSSSPSPPKKQSEVELAPKGGSGSPLPPLPSDTTAVRRREKSRFSSSGEESEAEEPKVQVKRASRLSFMEQSPQAERDSTITESPSHLTALSDAGSAPPAKQGVTGSFSFYDAELMDLMESIDSFDHSSQSADPNSTSTKASSQMPTEDSSDDGVFGGAALLPATKRLNFASPNKIDGLPMSTSADELEGQDMVKSPSASSITTISARMRESMKLASGGQVSMDTSFVETVLRELEDTKTRMQQLQHRYDQMKRASLSAAQGYSHAKSEFQHQVQAREDAELEMMNLRRQLADQASKLSLMTNQEKEKERLEQKQKDVKVTLEDMSKDLAKLTVERDMTVAEVAELIAIQDGRSPVPTPAAVVVPDSNTSEPVPDKSQLQSRLTVRLDGVKNKHRKEISELTEQRDALLLEIEDLKQSREVYLEETESLNARNEELNRLLAKLTSRVEAMTAAENAAANNRHHSSTPSVLSFQSRANSDHRDSTSIMGSASKGFGFGFGPRSKGRGGSPSIASAMKDSYFGSGSGNSTMSGTTMMETSEPNGSVGSRSGINLGPQAAAVARAEVTANIGQPQPIQMQQQYQQAPTTTASTASASAKKFKWMKPMARSAGQGLAAAIPLVHSPPVPPKAGSDSMRALYNNNSTSNLPNSSSPHNHAQGPAHLHGHHHRERDNSHDLVVREHVFQPFNVLRPTRCFACQKNMWGQSEVRCAICSQTCHSKCLQSLSISCSQPYTREGEAGAEKTGPSMFGRNLIEQANSEGRLIPTVVEKCIEAVEANGMDYEGIYRKSGGTSQLRVITQLFERGQRFDLMDMERFNDVSAITSVLKNYFRELPEPLLTFELHEEFVEWADTFKTTATADGAADGSTGTTTEDAKLQRMQSLVERLPRCHYATLRHLCTHLHNVSQRSEENRMHSRNLGVVFGPTLMRSTDGSREFSEMGQKATTIEYLAEHCKQVFAHTSNNGAGADVVGAGSGGAEAEE